MNAILGRFITTSDWIASQVLPMELLNELEKKSLRYLGHTLRNGLEQDIAFSERKNGPVLVAAGNKRRLARLWISDRSGHV